MGIVAKQSVRNALVLSTGLVLGAVNTMYVLPKAFEGFEEGWGLLRILTAWGTILAQIVALGSPSGIMRFLPKAGSAEREASMLSTLVLFPTAFLLLLAGASTFAGPDVLAWLDADAGWLLEGRIAAFLVMAGAYLAMMLLKAVLAHRMRTVAATAIQEVWLKGSYLGLAWLTSAASCRLKPSSGGSCTAMWRLWDSCSWKRCPAAQGLDVPP